MKLQSTFFPKSRFDTIQSNIHKYDWARDISRAIVEKAEHWRGLSLDEIWNIMFSSSITRAWFVRSDGHCPTCHQNVPMYTWEMDAAKRPWKTRCPHCGELFPKNDFHKYYLSGLDDHGLFVPSLADRSLLYNEEHPDPADPLHSFGVDDGDGYAEGSIRWWFIGAYLVYGQWKQLALGGLKNLSEAFAVTGDRAYARRAAVLLDRIADVFPRFSFLTQGIMYDVVPYVDGFVSYSVDHCMEMKDIVEAYDMIFDAMKEDEELLSFLSAKAAAKKLQNRKSCFADIQANIETNLLEMGISDPIKLDCNFPWEHVVKYLVKTVVDKPEYASERETLLDIIIRKSTAVNGTSGEKGLANYSSIATKTLSMFLAAMSEQDSAFLQKSIAKWPNITIMYKFFIDALCLGRYLPTVGDSGYFGYPALAKSNDFVHANKGFYSTVFTTEGLTPSAYLLLGRLYELTGDANYIRIVWHGNGCCVDNLPHDINCPDVEGFQRMVSEVIERQGAEFQVDSDNKEDWHLALMHGGRDENEHMACLTYDMRGADLHGHCDCMNLGLFAKGLNLMPDYGYPPVQYGGWFTPQATWYAKPSAHNTVVIDGRDQVRNKDGKTLLWADGQRLKAITLDGREVADAQQFERTTAMIEISESDFYLFDVFRVTGGRDHAFFLHSHFASLQTEGFELAPEEEYGHHALLRNFHGGAVMKPGWFSDWKIEDRYTLLSGDNNIHLRYTGLSSNVAAKVCESWVNAGDYNTTAEAWIPTMMLQRKSEAEPLATTFTGIIEPYENNPVVVSTKRLDIRLDDGSIAGESDVAVEVVLPDGRRDVLIAMNSSNDVGFDRTGTVKAGGTVLRFNGQLCLVSTDVDCSQRIIACNSRYLSVGNKELVLTGEAGYVELAVRAGSMQVVSGNAGLIVTFKA
jgi:oligo-alginate lyase